MYGIAGGPAPAAPCSASGSPAQLVGDVLGDPQRRGQPGRPDTGDAGVAPGGVDADLVVAVLGRGPQPGVGRGDLLTGQARDDPVPGLEQRGQPVRGGGGVGPVTDVL